MEPTDQHHLQVYTNTRITHSQCTQVTHHYIEKAGPTPDAVVSRN